MQVLLNVHLNRPHRASFQRPMTRFGETAPAVLLPNKEFLLNEIKEQPETLTRLLKQLPNDIHQLALPDKRPQQVVLIGEGSSKNALDAASPHIASWIQSPVVTHLPAPYLDTPALKGAMSAWRNPWDLVLAVSQSGKSSSTLKALEHLVYQSNSNNRSFRLIPITNNPQSRMAQLYGNHLYMRAGHEESIAATKSMTNSIMATLILGAHLAKRWDTDFPISNQMEQLQSIPEKLKAFINTPAVHDQLKTLASHLAKQNQFVLLSQGPMASILPEAGLKLTETSSNLVHTFNTESFKHGPKVILDNSPTTLYVVPPRLSDANAKIFFDDMKEHFRGDPTRPFNKKNIVVLRYNSSPDVPHEISQWADSPFIVTLPGAEKMKTPIDTIFLGIVTFQLLSYYLAEAKNINPNHPALTKAVTQ